MTREGFYRLTLRGLAVSFAVVGTSFLLSPDATVRSLDAVGAALGDFTPAPASELRFWLALAVAYMVLVTLLAWLAQRDLARYRHLLAILAAGKGSSSLFALGFYWFSADAFIYLANFLVDGAIAVGVIWIWATVPQLGLPRVAVESDESGPQPHALHALLEALVPAGGPFPEGASTPAMAEAVVAFASRAGGAAALRLFLGLLEISPFLLPPIWLRRFSRLPLADRVRLLQAWEDSALWPRRQAFHALKLTVMSHFYSRPEVRAHLGYPRPLERVPTNDLAAAEPSP